MSTTMNTTICRTVACRTVAVPALSRAQYASLVRQSTSRRVPAALLALAFLVLAMSGIARADETPVPQGTEITTFHAATRPVARPAPATPGKVAICTVLPSGALQCGAAVTLASVAQRAAR